MFSHSTLYLNHHVMNYFIITGTSSGIGEAIANRLIHRREKVFCISRRENPALNLLAKREHSGLWYYQFDLRNTSKIPGLMKEIFSFIDKETVSGIFLINNAGTLLPTGFSGTLNTSEIEEHYKTNLIAPALLINEFIKLTTELNINKTIINISSGAAVSAYAGWSNYCATKAGLDMLTRSIALEQKNASFPVKVLSVAPGIVDTPMQEIIRESKVEQFPMKEKFVALHQTNKLAGTDDTAQKIISLLFDNSLLGGEILDIRNL